MALLGDSASLLSLLPSVPPPALPLGCGSGSPSCKFSALPLPSLGALSALRPHLALDAFYCQYRVGGPSVCERLLCASTGPVVAGTWHILCERCCTDERAVQLGH